MNEIKMKFEVMANAAQVKSDQICSADDLQTELLEILNFTKENISSKKKLLECYSGLLNKNIKGPFEIIVFCMRELQWEEIKIAAKNQLESSDDPRVWSVMNDIIAVYEKEWENEDLYPYYYNQHSDGK